jgi:hypothetical protein
MSSWERKISLWKDFLVFNEEWKAKCDTINSQMNSKFEVLFRTKMREQVCRNGTIWSNDNFSVQFISDDFFWIFWVNQYQFFCKWRKSVSTFWSLLCQSLSSYMKFPLLARKNLNCSSFVIVRVFLLLSRSFPLKDEFSNLFQSNSFWPGSYQLKF